MRTIFIHGAFPPPVHGSANVTARIADLLLRQGARIVTLNVATPSSTVPGFAVAWRLWRSTSALIKLCLLHPTDQITLYIAVAKGFGKYFDLAAVCIGRLRRARIFLHFHNYSLLANDSLQIRPLLYLAGGSSKLIFLCADMARRAVNFSHVSDGLHIVSNAAFVDIRPRDGVGPISEREKLSLGFFSRITLDKGISDFIQLIRDVRALGFSCDAKVAGNFVDAPTEEFVRTQCQEHGITLVGPVYGADRERFLSTVDIFVFPSRYDHEAEPLVVYEALERGATVIAYQIGCLRKVNSSEFLQIIDPADLLTAVRVQIESLASQTNPSRELAYVEFERHQRKALIAAENLILDLVANP